MTAVTDLAEALLVAHQRHSISACACGWSELGRSHTRHQMEALEEAGLLSGSFSRKPWFPAREAAPAGAKLDVITANGKLIQGAEVANSWVLSIDKGVNSLSDRVVLYWRPADV